MIKNMAAFGAASHRTRSGARDHYRRVHSSLAAGIKQLNRHIKKYVQNYALDIERGNVPGDGSIIGISEEWLETAAVARALNEEPCMHIFHEDMAHFVDPKSFVVFCGHEELIFGGGRMPGFKLLRFVRAQPGVSAEVFDRSWRETYATAVAADSAVRAHCAVYLQNRTSEDERLALPLPPEVVQVAGVDEFWLEEPDGCGALKHALDAIASRVGVKGVICDHLVLATRATLLWDFDESPSMALERIAEAADLPAMS